MRVAIHFDGASTDAVREMAAALNAVGLRGQLRVGCDGPDHWSGETPRMTSTQWASVAARLVKFHGQPIADALRAVAS
jgi:hypothetical protein